MTVWLWTRAHEARVMRMIAVLCSVQKSTTLSFQTLNVANGVKKLSHGYVPKYTNYRKQLHIHESTYACYNLTRLTLSWSSCLESAGQITRFAFQYLFLAKLKAH